MSHPHITNSVGLLNTTRSRINLHMSKHHELNESSKYHELNKSSEYLDLYVSKYHEL